MAQAVVELCQKEYQLDVRAQLAGNTLSVLLPAGDLFESPVAMEPGADLAALSQQLKFSAKGLDQLQHVALVVRRVVLSTDAPIEFYVVTLRDAVGGQMELKWLGHVLDLKRLSLLDISQGEFLKYRALIYSQAIPTQAALTTVRQLFEDLRHREPVPVIARHFAPQADLKSLLPFLLQNVVVAVRPGEGLATLADTRARQIDERIVLVFARLLIPTQGVPAVREEGAYFVVETGEFRAGVRQIIPVLVRPVPHPSYGRWVIPPDLAAYGVPERWSEDDWYVEPVALPQFLADQVARRVRMDFGGKTGAPALGLAADYEDEAFEFQFRFGAPPRPAPPRPAARPAVVPDPTTPEGFATIIAQTTAQVVHNYRFKEFKKVTITDVDSGAAWVVSAEQLPLYRRRAAPLPSPLSP